MKGSAGKELCFELAKPTPSHPLSSMVAKWADGDQWEIPELSVEKYEAQQTSTKKKHKVYFEGEHKDTKHKLKVHYRSDRGDKHRMSLNEQKGKSLECW